MAAGPSRKTKLPLAEVLAKQNELNQTKKAMKI